MLNMEGQYHNLTLEGRKALTQTQNADHLIEVLDKILMLVLNVSVDLDLHCLQRQGIAGFSRNLVKLYTVCKSGS